MDQRNNSNAGARKMIYCWIIHTQHSRLYLFCIFVFRIRFFQFSFINIRLLVSVCFDEERERERTKNWLWILSTFHCLSSRIRWMVWQCSAIWVDVTERQKFHNKKDKQTLWRSSIWARMELEHDGTIFLIISKWMPSHRHSTYFVWKRIFFFSLWRSVERGHLINVHVKIVN